MWERGKWPRPAIEQAFWDRANRKAEGCWLWSGQINADGYGILRRRSAHRFAYELLVAKIPDGFEIDHKCSVRHCVNPDHMEAVDHTENIRRSWKRGKCEGIRHRLGSWQAAKTHCANGHKYSKKNTRIDEAGRRRCRICDSEKAKRYLRRVK